jgi:hypothetical protein
MAFLLGMVIPSCAGDEVPKNGTPPAPFTIDREARRVVGRAADGKTRWSVTLDGFIGGVRDPHLLWDARRVYISHTNGVTALDAATGEEHWHSDGPNDRLLLSGDLLLATDCTSDSYVGKQGRLLTARSVTTGKEVFRVQLPVKDFDPDPIEEVAGLFLVQTHEWPSGAGYSLLIDRQGNVQHRLKRQVVRGITPGG